MRRAGGARTAVPQCRLSGGCTGLSSPWHTLAFCPHASTLGALGFLLDVGVLPYKTIFLKTCALFPKNME